jgi:hypothetical protein
MGMASTIALYTNADGSGYFGTLRARVEVDGGANYYIFDKDGSGVINTLDKVNHSLLDFNFNNNVGGAPNPLGLTGDTSAVYRYGTFYTLTGASVKVALPTIGDNLNAPSLRSKTSVGNISASLGSNEVNTEYNDMLAIWDAYNGTGTGTNAGVSGVPAGWISSTYWASSKLDTTLDEHAYITLSSGGVSRAADVGSMYVAFQVL